jgi:hypothetical protein
LGSLRHPNLLTPLLQSLLQKTFRHRCSPALVEFLDDAIPCLELQGKNLFELFKQPLGLTRVMPVALQPDHKVKLRLDPSLTVRDVLIGKFEMPRDRVPIEARGHGPQPTIHD